MRRCYVCGRDTSRRVISEPVLVPICLDRVCADRAAQLSLRHCTGRSADGRLCGGKAVVGMAAGGRDLCAQHLHLIWEHHGAT